MPKNGSDVRLVDYHQRLLEMVRADVDKTQPFEEQEKEARSIMDSLLGPSWRTKADILDEPDTEVPADDSYLDNLDHVGNMFQLGKAPGVKHPITDGPNKPSKTADMSTALTELRDAINKLLDAR
jgi:hypothetical protein